MLLFIDFNLCYLYNVIFIIFNELFFIKFDCLVFDNDRKLMIGM